MFEDIMIPLFSLDTRTGKMEIADENGYYNGEVIYCVKREIGAASPEISLFKKEFQKVIDAGKMIGNIEKIETEKLYAMLLYADEMLHQENLVGYDKWNKVFEELEAVFKKRKKLN